MKLARCLLAGSLCWLASIGAAVAQAQTATLQASSNNYAAGGGTLTLTATISYAEQPTALGFEVGLPDGWSYVSGTNEPSIKPDSGTTGTLEWAYSSGFGTGSSSFTFTVNYPAGVSGNQTITAAAVYRSPLSNLSIASVVLSAMSTDVAPGFSSQPQNLSVMSGANASFAVSVAGTPTPTVRWQVSTNSGVSWTDIVNGGIYSGATAPTLNLTGVSVGLHGNRYRAMASNSVQANVPSNAATLSVTETPTGPAATLTPSAQTYSAAGGMISFTATIVHPEQPTALGFEVGLPTGWSYVSGTGEPSIKPEAGTTGTLEWAYSGGFGTGSSSFTFTVNYPAGLSGNQTITAAAVYRSPLASLSVPAIVLAARPTVATDWLGVKFSGTELANSAISGRNADPDGDGISNLMEYALGLEPKAAESGNGTEASATETEWRYTFSRPADRTDVTYLVEVSTDLVNWSTNGVSLSRTAVEASRETWRAGYPRASATNVFFRLRVEVQ